jgi:hypothetical protein
MREELLLDVPHRQVVFVIPRMLRIFFKYKRKLLGELCHAAVQTILKYFQAVTGTELVPAVVACIQTFGEQINFHPLCGAPHKGWKFIFCPNDWMTANTPGQSSVPVVKSENMQNFC